MSEDKTTISVNRDVALRFAKLARELGISIHKAATEALTAAEEILKDGENPTHLLYLYRVFKAKSATDSLSLPLHLLAKIFEELETGRYITLFYEAGRELGSVLAQWLAFQDLIKTPQVLKLLLPVRTAQCRVEENNARFTLIFPPNTKRLIPLIVAYLRGVFDAYGYTQHKAEQREHVLDIVVYNCIQ